MSEESVVVDERVDHALHLVHHSSLVGRPKITVEWRQGSGSVSLGSLVHPERPISLSTRPNDPILEAIARAVFMLFPRCLRCGEVIQRFEDADIRILTNRVVHRAECPPDRAAARQPG